MRDYAQLEPVFHPYLGFTSPANFRSPSVTTDSDGHRLSEFGGKVVTAQSARAARSYGVALGGSFAFGVGATSDARSFASSLGDQSGWPYLNRAVRAGNSMQEFLSALPMLDGATDVVVCSGINNLTLAYWSSRTWDDLGPFFYDEPLARLRGRPLDELAPVDGGSSLRETVRKGVAAMRDRPRSSGPPRPRLDADEIAGAAAARHLRELRLVRAAAPDAKRLIFVTQPLLDPEARDLHPNEQGLTGETVGPLESWWAATIEFVQTQWPGYVRRLEEGCDRLGIRFGMLDSVAFTGWAFVDRAHMTDDGQRQAASFVLEMMSDGRS